MPPPPAPASGKNPTRPPRHPTPLADQNHAPPAATRVSRPSECRADYSPSYQIGLPQTPPGPSSHPPNAIAPAPPPHDASRSDAPPPAPPPNDPNRTRSPAHNASRSRSPHIHSQSRNP